MSEPMKGLSVSSRSDIGPVDTSGVTALAHGVAAGRIGVAIGTLGTGLEIESYAIAIRLT